MDELRLEELCQVLYVPVVDRIGRLAQDQREHLGLKNGLSGFDIDPQIRHMSKVTITGYFESNFFS